MERGAGFGRIDDRRKNKLKYSELVGEPVRLEIQGGRMFYGILKATNISKTVLQPSLVNEVTLVGEEWKDQFRWENEGPTILDTFYVTSAQKVRKEYLDYLVESTDRNPKIVVSRR